jgi:DNA polymerase-3 subunit gamma/tau
MNLYLKYRPRTIAELDLSSVRKSLSDIVAANKVAHAYLLTGPRGAGKTSTARVLARIVNCEKNRKQLGEPCNTCAACVSILDGSAMDVIEIDAASNRGIDDIRELKEKIRLAPAQLPTKVYIIDEVHMLTTEAFNALLKTLEEPPKHSLFILCTTELHKVPETIISRCVQIHFTKATQEEMTRSFTRVVTGEGKVVSPEALLYLSSAVDGSFRDGVKILDQVLSNSSDVTLEAVQLVVVGSAGYTVVPLLEALVARDGELALSELQTALQAGVDLSYLIVSAMRGLRDSLLSAWGVKENPLRVSVDPTVTKLIFALDEVARKLATSLDGELLVQTVIVEWCGLPENPENQKNKKPKTVDKEPVSKVVEKKQEVVADNQETESITQPTDSSMDNTEVWQKLMGSLEGDNYSLGALLSKAGLARIQGDILTISVQYDFHKEQLMTEKILTKLEKLVSQVMGRPMRVTCEIGIVTPLQAMSQHATIPGETSAETDTSLVDMAEEIFTN